MPGDFTGYAIDTCDAPSQRAMNAWRRGSKYAGIGIYVAGMNRACSSQPNLTRRWVRAQASRGWRLLPLVVGRQASCSPPGYYRGKRISAKPARDYARARAQGTKAARSGAKAVRRLGIGRGSVVWFDLEHFDLGNRRCRASAMAFTSAWTRQLHRQKFRSGLYSSAASGIRMVDAERASASRKRAVPDYIWVAEWNLRRHPALGVHLEAGVVAEPARPPVPRRPHRAARRRRARRRQQRAAHRAGHPSRASPARAAACA